MGVSGRMVRRDAPAEACPTRYTIVRDGMQTVPLAYRSLPLTHAWVARSGDKPLSWCPRMIHSRRSADQGGRACNVSRGGDGNEHGGDSPPARPSWGYF